VCKDSPPEYPKHSNTFPKHKSHPKPKNTKLKPADTRFTAQQAEGTRPGADRRLESREEGQGSSQVAG